jgi:ferredoxin-NADP reductase
MPVRAPSPEVAPTVTAVRRGRGIRGRLLAAAACLTTPLQPEDYLSLLNPLWSADGLRGRLEAVERETADAATLMIRPGRGWVEHRSGQFLRLGVEVQGARHWRNYSLSCPPGRADGRLAITVKAHPGGVVSSHLVHRARPGAILALSGPFGAFVLPEAIPERLLFLTAGSGITPVMAMLRALAARGPLPDIVLVHSAPWADQVIFGAELRALAQQHRGLRLHERHTRSPGGTGRFTAGELPGLCPDWASRRTWACGPNGLLDDVERFWRLGGQADQLCVERFHPWRRPGGGAGGQVRFAISNRQTAADGDTPLSAAAERAGVTVPAGCRVGVCRSCVARLRSGWVRDLDTGQERPAAAQLIRTCMSAAIGAVELDL